MIYSWKQWYPKYKRNLYDSISKANKKPNYKSGEDLNRYFFQGRQTESQHTHENIVSIPNQQECANQYLRPLHTFQNDYLSKDEKKKNVLVRIWRKENPHVLLMGMCVDAATMENSIYMPQKIKIEALYDLVFPYLCAYSRNKNIN